MHLSMQQMKEAHDAWVAIQEVERQRARWRKYLADLEYTEKRMGPMGFEFAPEVRSVPTAFEGEGRRRDVHVRVPISVVRGYAQDRIAACERQIRQLGGIPEDGK